MERERVTPRTDLAALLKAQGLSFHGGDAYWREDACYRFTLAEIEEIESATTELQTLCIAALGRLLREKRLGELKIPQLYWPQIERSLERGDFSLYGRLDLVYDGSSPPRLLEYNADTPTSLLETAVCQWYWLKDRFPARDQFNSVHERLIDRWRELPGNGPVHFAYLSDHEEDWVCVAYLMDTVTQAGRTALPLEIESLGWDSAKTAFVDLAGQPIENLFKLYPWEWMMREEFGAHVLTSATRFVEPLWKSPLACKGLLAILWEYYPGHPNLLPAFFDPHGLTDYARKPLYSREGANVELVKGGHRFASAPGPYGAEGYIYQALQELPDFRGHFPVLGSWLVAGQAAGMGIREDDSPITTNTSHFIPHYFV